jgi:hypothetical protein
VQLIQKIFVNKKKSQSCQISRKCFLKLTYLDNRFHICIYIYISLQFCGFEVLVNLSKIWKFSSIWKIISFHFLSSQCKCFGQNQKLLVPRGHKNIARCLLFFFPPSYLTCSQIWLIPLVDDCPCDYITNWEKKKGEKTCL